MRKLVLYAALCGPLLLLGSCAATHSPPPAPVAAQALVQVQLDSTQFRQPAALPLVLVTPRPTLLDQLRHRTPAPVAYRGLPAKIKNSTVNVTYNRVAGDQANTTTTTSTSTAKNGRTVVGDGASNTEAGKKAGPLTQAAQGAAVHVAATKKGPAQAGDGNRSTEKGGWPWWLWLLIAAGVLTGVYQVYKRFTPT